MPKKHQIPNQMIKLPIIQEIRIDDVIIENRLRKVDLKKIDELKNSIQEIGLLSPIILSKDNKLIAGAHRIEAYKQLGKKTIQYIYLESKDPLDIELAEIDENLIRTELHYIDRGNFLKKRKEIHEKKYPETKKGAVNQYTKVLNPESGNSKETPKSFLQDTAEKTKISKSVIAEELQIATNLTEEEQKVVKEKHLPKTEALELARQTPEMKAKITKKIELKPIHTKTEKISIKETKKELTEEELLNTLLTNEQLEIIKIKELPIIEAIELTKQSEEMRQKIFNKIREKPKHDFDHKINIKSIIEEIQKEELLSPILTKEELEIVKSKNISITIVTFLKNQDKELLQKIIEQIKDIPVQNLQHINDFQKIKRDIQREEHAKKTIEPPKLEEKEFNVIYADPPWKYNFAETENREIENQYQTMDLEDIKKIIIPTAENAVLLLWATAPKIIEALEVMKAWNFDYKTHAIWNKEIIGMGYWFRGQHELLLIGTKGKFSPPTPENRYSSLITERRTKHSKKPDIVYQMIEKMFPNQKYLELFARQKYNDNWFIWGNEI